METEEGLIWILYKNKIMINCFKSVYMLLKHPRFKDSDCPYKLFDVVRMEDGDLLMWNRWIIECHLLK
jgi:hypothetical protein